ncbi:unnamed protein product [Polarella glacialis]|uniref:Uncharacterized protein n=1 Tax=Polarella glacialis TaxID=89957 RepID=A0A813JI28_POLGL|nr:unnamed protein product [Polarella glacialis]
MLAALVKFFHVHRLGKLTLWPMSRALRQAFQATTSPPVGGWTQNPGDLVFVQPRWRGRQTGNATANFTRFAYGGGPYLTQSSAGLVQAVLDRLGYLEDGGHLGEATDLFCIANRKELQKFELQEKDSLSSKLSKLHAIFTSQHRLQAWRVSYDDIGVREHLQQTGHIQSAGAAKEQVLEGMRDLLLKEAGLRPQELPQSYTALTAHCLRHINRRDPNNRR